MRLQLLVTPLLLLLPCQQGCTDSVQAIGCNLHARNLIDQIYWCTESLAFISMVRPSIP